MSVPAAPSCAVDASALLAYLLSEPGSAVVRRHLPGAVVSSVNWSEVVQKAISRGVDTVAMRQDLAAVGAVVVPFDAEDAERAAQLWRPTQSLGLSLADRARLALGQRHGIPVLTADRVWMQVSLRITIVVIR